MKAEDLRIGNFVKFNRLSPYYESLKDKIYIVYSINECESLEKGIWTHSIGVEHLNTKGNVLFNRYSQFIEYLSPINLNEMLVQNFGFEYNRREMCWNDKTDWCLTNKMITGEGLIYNYFNSNYDRRLQYNIIKYAHELQNFYYALNRQEIDYKL